MYDLVGYISNVYDFVVLKCLDDETFPPVKTKHLICKRHKLEFSEHVVDLPFKLDIVLYITMGNINYSMMLVFLTLLLLHITVNLEK